MKIVAIGRTEILFKTVELLVKNGYEIPLIITSKESPEYTQKSKDFEKLAKKISAQYIFTSKLDNHIDEIKKAKADIAVSINYTSIISQRVIDIFSQGILNAHGGDLPRYRGNACQAWAILSGEKKIGLCIHSMIGEEVDSGNIIARDYMPIDINTKITQCWEWMNKKVPTMFLEAIRKLQEDRNFILEIQSTNHKDILRCYPRLPEDGRIDWNRSNIEILRLINASNKPYSGAYCFFKGAKLIIWDAEIYDDEENYLAVAGQVSALNTDMSVVVIAGSGKLKIKMIEYGNFFGKPKAIIKSVRRRLR